jgi:hypothetical protein
MKQFTDFSKRSNSCSEKGTPRSSINSTTKDPVKTANNEFENFLGGIGQVPANRGNEEFISGDGQGEKRVGERVEVKGLVADVGKWCKESGVGDLHRFNKNPPKMSGNNCMDEDNSDFEMGTPAREGEPCPAPGLAEIDVARGFSMHMKQKFKNQPGQSCGLESPALSENINFEIRKTNPFPGKDSKNFPQVDFSPTPYEISRDPEPLMDHSSPDIHHATYENNPNMTDSDTLSNDHSRCIPSPTTLLLKNNDRQNPFTLNNFLNPNAQNPNSLLNSHNKKFDTVNSERRFQENNPESEATSNTARNLDSKNWPAFYGQKKIAPVMKVNNTGGNNFCGGNEGKNMGLVGIGEVNLGEKSEFGNFELGRGDDGEVRDKDGEGLMSQDLMYNSAGFITDIMGRTWNFVESQDSQIL